MKKILIGILVVVAIIAIWLVGVYNSLVLNRATVDKEWSNVEVQYQRRSDLIPPLVATVSGVANFEQNTLTQVVEARARATSTTVNPSDATSLQQFQDSQMAL